MKHYLNFAVLGAAGALLLGACTAKEQQPEAKAAPEAVSFDAYLNRGVATKAGTAGELVLDNLKNEGFGVFGYYTNDVLYSQAFLPNFMYNEWVYFYHPDNIWQYDYPKYWPNEFGSNAESENVDRVSFFAYAPYVEVDASTGLVTGDQTYGITKVTRATDSGDPKVSYLASFTPAQCVDLCWGVAAADLTAGLGTPDGTNNVSKDDPFLNVAKLPANTPVKYSFKHALAALNVQIDAVIDAQDDPTWTNGATRIYVRSVTFQGFATEGQLNLNSSYNTPLWKNYDGNGTVSTAPVTVYDGRRDGREATSAAATELPVGLNPVIIQKDGLATQDGVTATAVNLFNDATDATPVYVVPNDDALRVTIVYDVETQDPDVLSTYLADGTTHGSVIENVITQVVKDGTGAEIIMEAGKKYTLKLHLGMVSAQFSATVSDWGAETSAAENLPANS